MSSKTVDPALAGGQETDIVIPVMGPTKSGKSSFLNQLIGLDKFKVGGKMAACTSEVGSHVVLKAPRVNVALNKALKGRRIVLVDTPSFDHTYIGNEEVLSCISDWLAESYKRKMLVGGVLYLHDINRDDSPRSSLELFAKLCGNDAMEQVAFVTTKWDKLQNIEEGQQRVEELESDFWRDMIDHGASVRHVQPPDIERPLTPQHKKPWDIIHEMVVSMNARNVHCQILQIQDEIVNRRLFLPETVAGREVRSSLNRLLQAAKDLKRKAKEDAKAGRPGASLKKQQEEIDKLTAQLKALKLPGIRARAKRWFSKGRRGTR